MTESEAIKEVRFNMSTIGLNNEASKRVVEARDMAIKELEKQIPRKRDNYSCPICSHYFEDGECFTYCPECGQKLDWSDEE